ncbi:MAG: hypothetical protein JSS27_04760 [Planctomycetes bacterium]|nr:hypothetical protein [Planctomycetota bacterium]
MNFAGLITMLLLGLTAEEAPLAPRAAEPYRVTVALQVSRDPLFTRLFNDSLERQVRDQLASYFGELAVVEVVREHPLIDRLGKQPLEAWSFSREDFAKADFPDKAFVVAIDRPDDLYRIRWRQLDRGLDFLGPSRSRLTPDRLWVAKAVCLALYEDFAPTATVEPAKTPGHVVLRFRGAGRGPRLGEMLRPGTVLQPFSVSRSADGGQLPAAMSNTVLRLQQPVEDFYLARFDTSLPDPWQLTGRTVGFQALRLKTVDGRLRLRLTDPDGRPVQEYSVLGNSEGFDTLEARHRFPPPDRHGWYLPGETFHHVAYLRLSQPNRPAAMLPVPITDDVVELTRKVIVDRAASAKNDYDRQVRYLVEDVRVLQQSQNNLVGQANRLYEEKKYEQLQEHLQLNVATIEKLRVTAVAGVLELEKQIAAEKLPADPLMAWLNSELKAIKNKGEQLANMSRRVAAAIELNNAQSRADVISDLGLQAEGVGDAETAFEKYEQALAEQPDQPDLRKRLERLREVWRIKDGTHQQAREFVQGAWKSLEVSKLDTNLSQAQAHAKTLESKGDFLTLRQLMLTTNAHMQTVTELVSQLANNEETAGKAEHERFAKLLGQLAEFHTSLSKSVDELRAAHQSAPASQPEPAPAAAKADEAKP